MAPEVHQSAATQRQLHTRVLGLLLSKGVTAVSAQLVRDGIPTYPRRGHMRTIGLMLLLLSTTAHAGAGTEPDYLPSPKPEVAKSEAKVDPPTVPAFELPAVEAGFHGMRELRVRGRPLQGTEVSVKGYVTSIYDCAAVLAVAN